MADLNLGSMLSGVGSLQSSRNDMLTSALDIFEPHPRDKGLVDGRNFYVHPVTLSEDGPYDFVIPSEGPLQYLAVGDIRLLGDISIKPTDGKVLKKDDGTVVSLVNGFDQAMWKSIDIEANGKLLTSLSSAHYAYKSYIERVLSYSKEALAAYFSPSTFHPLDTVSYANRNDLTKYPNLIKEIVDFAEENKIQFSAPLHNDFLNQQRYLPSGINLRIRLHRNTDQFTLFQVKSADATAPQRTFKLKIHDLRLQIRKIDIHPKLYEYHLNKWKTQEAIFPFTRTVIKTYNIPTNARAFNIQGMYKGILPYQIINAFVDTESFNGSIHTNPFYFHHYNINYYQLYHNGKPIPALPYQTDYTNDLPAREYRDFLDNIGLKGDNNSVAVQTKDYVYGHHFKVADLTPDQCSSYHNHQGSFGDISVSMTFPGDHVGITMISFASFSSTFYIDQDRNINVDPAQSIA